MKNLILVLWILCSGIAVEAQQYVVDINRSSLKWTGYGELGSFEQSGTIDLKSAEIEVHSGELVGANIVVDMKTIDHEDAQLKGHLKNKDFFYIHKYPEASMQFQRLEGSTVFAQISIRGKEGQLEFPVQMELEDNRLIVTGQMTIDRTQFDIKYNSSSFFQDLGNYAIKNEFDLKFELVCSKMD